jgi:hypothetical protein
VSILDETRMIVYAARNAGKDLDNLTLSMSRLNEFLLAAASNRCLTISEIEEMRQSCLRGEAKAWGIPVKFTDESAS